MLSPTAKLCFIWLTIITLIIPCFLSQTFKASGRQYESQAVYRQMVKAQSDARIRVNNEKYGQYYRSGHNKFSVYTQDQWKKLFLGGMESDPNSQQAKYVQRISHQQKSKLSLQLKAGLLNAVVPAVFNIDYTTTNPPLVTSVKDQGSCGSCWAFAAIAEMQTYFLKKHKIYLDLSEQQMVDCVSTVSPSFGCNGGYLWAVGYYAVLNSIAQQKYYQYQGVELGRCATEKISSGNTFKIGSYAYIRDCITLINALLTYKPIAVCAGVDTNWMHYISGVMPVCNEDKTGGHCFLLVGATSDGTSNILTNWYKFKNSWGTTYGENGYIRIYRNSQDTTVGPCAVCKWPSMYTI